jgi:tetratricopeptide (TPR) repeat protein
MWAGDPEAAEVELRSNCEMLLERGERAWFCSLACLLAEALYQQGRDDEALEWLERSRETAPTEDLEAMSDRRCIEGKILARRGRFDEAVEAVQEGLAFAQRTTEIDHIADAWADVFEVMRLAGRHEEAREAADEAIAMYERKGNLAGAAIVRRGLDAAGS